MLGKEGFAEFQTVYGKNFEDLRKKWIEVKESEITEGEQTRVEIFSKFKTLLEKHNKGIVV
jgi:hypothetical protein